LEASYDVLDTILTYEERSELETCIGLLWPDNSSLSKYCRAVALKCLGDGRGHLFYPQEGVRYVDFTRCQQERPLMQAAADDAFLLLRKPSATARELLPADFFHVRPFSSLSMAIGLRMAALEKAAQVRSAPLLQQEACEQEYGTFHSFMFTVVQGVKLPRTPEPTPVPTRPRVSERIVISSALDVTQARVLLRELPRQVGIKCEGTPLSRSGRLCLVQVRSSLHAVVQLP